MSSYSDKDLSSAMEDVKNGTPIREAARLHNVPRTTLQGRLSGRNARRLISQEQQRLSTVHEKGLVDWIIRQESLGFAPTHAQLRAIAASLLESQGSHSSLGKRWATSFIQRHPNIQSKLGRRTEWSRVNAACPENINKLFSLYETFDWIPPSQRYNADEGGIIEGQGANGLVIGSSEGKGASQTPTKLDTSRTWISFIECISATGTALNPLIIFKGKNVQDQWFCTKFLQDHASWHTTVSANGWTSNIIALEWLEKVFLPETKPEDQSQPRLLIVDGHGSHTTDAFMTACFLNNVFMLFLPAHTSHILQPLDLGCFSALKTDYKRQIGDFMSLTDTSRVGKLKFLDFYAHAREVGLRKSNILAGWRASGLWPINALKPLRSRWVVARPASPPPRSILNEITTPTRGQEVKWLLKRKADTPTSRLIVRKIAKVIDKQAIDLSILTREVGALRSQLDDLQPKKRRAIKPQPNERFISLGEILASRNCNPSQRGLEAVNNEDEIIVADEEGEGSQSDGSIAEPPRRRPTRGLARQSRYYSPSECSDE
jgi:hypothetical protein